MKRLGLALLLIGLFAGGMRLDAAEQASNTKLLAHTTAAEALGKIGDPAAYSFLTRCLDSNDFFVRAYAAQALGKINDKNAIPALRKLLNDRNYLARVYATAALAALGDGPAQQAYLACFKNSDYLTRLTAVSQSGDMGKKYQQLLRNLLTQENDPIVRAKIMEQLEIQAGPSGTEAVQDQTPAVLIKALEDPIGEIRQAACVALGTLASKEAIPALIERLGDADPRVRAAAKEALASLGESSLIQFFRQDLDETNPVLRSSSFIALARLNSIEVVPVLIQAAVDPETPTLVRVQAVRALGIIKPYVARVVNNGLVLTNLQQTLVADKNLGIGYQSNGKALVTVFIEALRNPSSPLHADAPFVLKEFADPASLPALREILRQGAGDVALSSLYALGELRDKDAVEDILAFCKRF